MTTISTKMAISINNSNASSSNKMHHHIHHHNRCKESTSTPLTLLQWWFNRLPVLPWTETPSSPPPSSSTLTSRTTMSSSNNVGNSSSLKISPAIAPETIKARNQKTRSATEGARMHQQRHLQQDITAASSSSSLSSPFSAPAKAPTTLVQSSGSTTASLSSSSRFTSSAKPAWSPSQLAASTTITSVSGANNSSDPYFYSRIAVHALAAASTVSTLSLLPAFGKKGLDIGFGCGTQYLTIIGLILSSTFFTASVILDLTGWQFLWRIRNTLMTPLVPMNVMITMLYWGLVATDPSYIYIGERYLPLWLDVQMHGLPAVFILIELFCFPGTFRANRNQDIAVVFFTAILYNFWCTLCAFMDGDHWPYPVMEGLTHSTRFMFMMSINVASILIHYSLLELHIWHKPQWYARTVMHAVKGLQGDQK